MTRETGTLQWTHDAVVHHHDGNFPVGGPLDFLPHDGVNLHHLIREAMIVQEGAHFTAERTGFILIQRQLQIPLKGRRRRRRLGGKKVELFSIHGKESKSTLNSER